MVVQSFAEVGGGVFWRLIHILLFLFFNFCSPGCGPVMDPHRLPARQGPSNPFKGEKP